MQQVTISQISGAFTRIQARIYARRMTREEHDAAQADLNLLEGALAKLVQVPVPAPQDPLAGQGAPAPKSAKERLAAAREPAPVSEK